MAADNEGALTTPPTRCALCDDEETLTWVSLASDNGASKRVVVCSSCYLDLRAAPEDAEPAIED
ncbi:MAG: hypothetical protein JWM53_1229 [bacterium]|nr:hypothetical protein [bacterium]